MKPLTVFENRRLLESARAYLTLGLYQRANDELEQMSRDTRRWAEVLAVKLAIFSALDLWDMAEIAAWQLYDSTSNSEAAVRPSLAGEKRGQAGRTSAVSAWSKAAVSYLPNPCSLSQ